MAITYVPLTTTTVSSLVTEINITSIPQTYTDLIISLSWRGANNQGLRVQYNGITGSNYSSTALACQGTTTVTDLRQSGTSNVFLMDYSSNTDSWFANCIIDCNDYRNTSQARNFQYLGGSSSSSSGTQFFIQGMFTDNAGTAALTSIRFFNVDFQVGTTVTMWGVLRA